MLDLRAEYPLFRDDVRAAVDAVLESQHFIGGPAVAKLEEEIAALSNTKHAVAVGTGTDALLCALMALNIGAGDEVILPSFTFFATAGCVFRMGARPVFVDVDARTFNLVPQRVRDALTPRTKAIIAVHLFGQCADMDDILDIARPRNIAALEDAAQAIGATYRGRCAGAMGDLASFSFYPTKNLGGFGEGGMILSNDERLATLCRQLRNHGGSQRYVHEHVGGNFRLDTMKAAILSVKLRRLGEFTAKRRANAKRYDERLAGLPVLTPLVREHCEHVYHQYSILCDRRDELIAHLRERGVEAGVYYPIPLHLQACFHSLGYKLGDLPITEETCSRILSLPCHPMLADGDVDYVAECIAEFFAGCANGPIVECDAARVVPGAGVGGPPHRDSTVIAGQRGLRV